MSSAVAVTCKPLGYHVDKKSFADAEWTRGILIDHPIAFSCPTFLHAWILNYSRGHNRRTIFRLQTQKESQQSTKQRGKIKQILQRRIGLRTRMVTNKGEERERKQVPFAIAFHDLTTFVLFLKKNTSAHRRNNYHLYVYERVVFGHTGHWTCARREQDTAVLLHSIRSFTRSAIIQLFLLSPSIAAWCWSLRCSLYAACS